MEVSTGWKAIANHHLEIYHLYCCVSYHESAKSTEDEGIGWCDLQASRYDKGYWEERGTAQNTPTGDDRAGSKPVIGSSVPYGPGKEKNRVPLMKLIEIATWNVCSMSDGKIEVVESERW